MYIQVLHGRNRGRAALSSLPRNHLQVHNILNTQGGHKIICCYSTYISQSRHDRAQDSLAPGGDNQVVREMLGGAGHHYHRALSF